MQLLQSGVDTATIAIWLGHEDIRTCQIYLHADLELKQRALARTAPPDTAAGRYRPPDPLLAFLEGLRLCGPVLAQHPYRQRELAVG
jgi:integrase/recombinase XerD